MRPTLPGAARGLERDVVAAATAVQGRDRAEVRRLVGQLSERESEQVRGLLHVLVLDLLERAHPDGLDADDVRALLDTLLAETASWLPGLDPHAVVLVLSGVLSVHDDDAPPMAYADLLTACVVLVVHLVTVLDLSLVGLLDDAFAELHRAQTMEMP